MKYLGIMGRGYRFNEKDGAYFISFATVYWIDVFIREAYFKIIIDSLNYCRKYKGMQIYSYVVMPSHVHMILRSSEGDPSGLMRDFKGFTSRQMLKAITENFSESRRDWMIEKFRRAGEKKTNVQSMQFWQHGNHAFELWSADIFKQKVDYIHNNPVKAGFVLNPEDWKYSSAKNYLKDDHSILEIDLL